MQPCNLYKEERQSFPERKLALFLCQTISQIAFACALAPRSQREPCAQS